MYLSINESMFSFEFIILLLSSQSISKITFYNFGTCSVKSRLELVTLSISIRFQVVDTILWPKQCSLVFSKLQFIVITIQQQGQA